MKRTSPDDYDYIVINDDLENCFKQIEKLSYFYKKPIVPVQFSNFIIYFDFKSDGLKFRLRF